VDKGKFELKKEKKAPLCCGERIGEANAMIPKGKANPRNGRENLGRPSERELGRR